MRCQSVTVCGLLLVAAVASAQETTAVQVRGVVIAGQGAAIPGALVEIGRAKDSTRTNARGEFDFSGVAPGIYRLRVRALGYRETYEDIRVERDVGWTGTVVMYRVAQNLPDVTVQAVGKPPEFANTSKYDDYFRRQRIGQGVFRTREDILRMGVTDVAGALQAIPGVSVLNTMNFHGEPETRFRIARCPGQPPHIAIFLNGARVPLFLKYAENKGSELSALTAGGARKPASTCEDCVRLSEALSSIPFSDILFLEFYRGPSQIPSDLDRGDYCAALVIWTR